MSPLWVATDDEVQWIWVVSCACRGTQSLRDTNTPYRHIEYSRVDVR